MKKKKILVLFLVLAVSVTASAATILSDGFDDGTRDSSVDGADWYKVTASSNLILGVADDTAGLGSGNAMNFTNNSNSTSRAVVANFADVTLANPYDSITLSFDGRAYSTDESDDDFRFGLFNNMGTALSADESSSATTDNDDLGYFARGSTGTTLDVIDLVEDKGTSTVLGGSSIAIKGSTATTTTFLPGSMVERAFVLELWLSAGGGKIMMDLYIDGGLVLSDFDDSTLVTTFNEVGFGSNANPDFVVDNVLVETVVHIPEPATLGLLAMGCLALRRKLK